ARLGGLRGVHRGGPAAGPLALDGAGAGQQHGGGAGRDDGDPRRVLRVEAILAGGLPPADGPGAAGARSARPDAEPVAVIGPARSWTMHARIARLYVNNYRCFVNFELRPGRRSLLLGYNGSGKSSAFDVLHAIRDLVF